MEPRINAQTEKTPSRSKKSNSQDDREGLESPRERSTVFGVEDQNRLISGNSSRSNLSRNGRPQGGKIHLGKILKRVEYLEQQFLDYVHAHQTRLETRLGESKQREEIFLEVAQELKDELLAAIDSEDDTGQSTDAEE